MNNETSNKKSHENDFIEGRIIFCKVKATGQGCTSAFVEKATSDFSSLEQFYFFPCWQKLFCFPGYKQLE